VSNHSETSKLRNLLTLIVFSLLDYSAAIAQDSSAPSDSRIAFQLAYSSQNLEYLSQNIDLFQDLVIYIEDTGYEVEYRPMISIGFFPTEELLQEQLSWLTPLFPDGRIYQAGDSLHNIVTSALIDGDIDTEAVGVFVLNFDNSGDFSEQLTSSQMLARAREFYDQGNYKSAALRYDLLAVFSDQATTAIAVELLGVSLERSGNYAQAAEAYQRVLNDFPNAVGAPRVGQRLMAMQSVAATSAPQLRQASRQREEARLTTRGVFGQYYRSLSRSIDGRSSEDVMGLLTTDFDFRSTYQSGSHSLQARLNGYSLYDQLNGDDTDLRIKRAYLAYEHDSGASIKLGRQRDFDSGTFTSFDGIRLAYPLLENLEIFTSTGVPIYFSDVYDPIDYRFHALGAGWKINEKWELTSYYNNQTLNGVTDREALGMRLFYVDEKLSNALTVDYDLAFSELNNLMWNVTWHYTDRIDISTVIGRQHSPFLSASNILIGQADLNLDVYLQSKENEDALLDDALSRTSTNTYYSLAVNTDLREDLRLYASYYKSDLTDIPSSSFLLGEEIAGQGNLEFSTSNVAVQLIKDGLFFANESTAFGLRHGTGSNNTSNQLFINERVRFGNRFTLMPRLSYTLIKLDQNGDKQHQLRYSLAAIYRPTRSTEFNLELGNEAIDRDIGDSTFDSTYIFVGYRLIF